MTGSSSRVRCPDAMGADAEQRVFDALDPAKDVDGFHPERWSASCRIARS